MSELSVGFASDFGVTTIDIAAFYKDNWQRGIALTQPDFLDWQFVDAPDGNGKNHCVVAHDGKDILSIMGANARTFLFRGEPLLGAELTTWITAEAARGKGLGRNILSYLQNHFDILAGAGITRAALSLYLAKGFVFRAHIPRFLHVANFEAARALTEISIQAEKLTLHRQSQAPRVNWQAKQVAASDTAHLQCCYNASMFSRSAANLAWRYDTHPVFAYETYIASDVSVDCNSMAVVLRVDKIKGIDILHIVDMYGDLRHAQAALAFVADMALNRAAFVDASFTYEPLTAHFHQQGWSSVVDDPFLQLPSLFYPVELRQPPTTSICFWSRAQRTGLYRFGSLHFSKSDLDIDRPTLDYYVSHGISVN